jgi:hypothetical protein
MADQLYAIMTDSPYICDNRVLARKLPEFCGPRDWWTDRSNKTLWLMNYTQARSIVSDYRYNNPRIVKAQKAIATLEKQNA